MGTVTLGGAYGPGSTYCNADIGCSDSTGALADSSFTVLTVNKKNLKNISFAYVEPGGGVNTNFAFNASGGAMVGSHPGTGLYNVVFNGLNGIGGTVQIVTAGSNFTNSRCYSGGWNSNPINISVVCTDHNGFPADSDYYVAFIPSGATPANVGYVWANSPSVASYTPNTSYSYNPAGAVNIVRSTAGQYAVTFAGLYQQAAGNVQVTAYNNSGTATGNYCKVVSWGQGTTFADLVVNVACFDNVGDPADYQYTVLAVGPQALTLTCSPATGPTKVGVAYQSGCVVTGGNLSNYTFAVSSGTLPPGLSYTQISQNIAALSGTPQAAGSYNFTVSVSDTATPPDKATFNFTGTIAAAASSLTLTCNPTTGPATAGVAYTSTCTITGGTAPYSFNPPVNGVLGTQVPTGLTFTQTNATTITVSGTPTAAGSYQYAVIVKDSGSPTQIFTMSFTGTVAAGSPVITPITPTNGAVGTSYSFQFSASGGTSPYTFSVTSGGVPPGLTLSSGGLLSGTPATAGTSGFTVTVKDANAATGSFTASLTIQAAGGSGGGTQTYYFSHLAFAGGWQTTLTYINYSPQTVTCTTNFFSDTGGALALPFSAGTLSTRTDVMPPGGSVHDQTIASLTAAVTSGWAQGSCSGPVQASVLFRFFQAGQSAGAAPVAVGEASLNAETVPATKFVTFAETSTGVAYANPSTTQSAVVTFTVYNAAGAKLGTTSITLGPLQHSAANLGPMLGLTNFVGSVQITSTSPIISLSLNFEAAPIFSALPPGDLSSSTVLVP